MPREMFSDVEHSLPYMKSFVNRNTLSTQASAIITAILKTL